MQSINQTTTSQSRKIARIIYEDTQRLIKMDDSDPKRAELEQSIDRLYRLYGTLRR